MNAEIIRTQRQYLGLYESQEIYLLGKSRQFLDNLLHQAEELQFAEDCSVRIAAEINRVACLKLLGRLD
ncbi:MAG: hypothetical protein WCS42_13115 [Verrucomicrobiota bacterium]